MALALVARVALVLAIVDFPEGVPLLRQGRRMGRWAPPILSTLSAEAGRRAAWPQLPREGRHRAAHLLVLRHPRDPQVRIPALAAAVLLWPVLGPHGPTEALLAPIGSSRAQLLAWNLLHAGPFIAAIRAILRTLFAPASVPSPMAARVEPLAHGCAQLQVLPADDVHVTLQQLEHGCEVRYLLLGVHALLQDPIHVGATGRQARSTRSQGKRQGLLCSRALTPRLPGRRKGIAGRHECLRRAAADLRLRWRLRMPHAARLNRCPLAAAAGGDRRAS
mmetsp:Transcript_90723/g.216577  ORF Transcript_90723/g.216577 Transcript_90723/m.216577 type:complete len:277 (+) Transcript_90723:4453-5283(+)